MKSEPNVILRLAMDVFLSILREKWGGVAELSEALPSSSRQGFLSDWMQGNWEMIVEAAAAASHVPGRTFLEPYGDGADCNSVGSRVWMPGVESTHAIHCVPRIGSVVWDHLMQSEVEVPSAGLLFDRFAVRTDAGWYAERPPFDHILAFVDGREALFAAADIELILRKIEGSRPARAD